MERTFDFGTFRIDASIVGSDPERDLFAVRVIIRAPEAEHVETVGVSNPLLSSAAIALLQDMFQVLRYGIQRFVSGAMLKHRLSREHYEEIRRRAASLFRIAGAIGEPAIQAALETLKQEEAQEAAAMQQAAERFGEALEKAATHDLDLGSARARVQLLGPAPPLGLPVWRVTLAVPGGPSHTMDLLIKAPRAWVPVLAALDELTTVYNFGIDAYATQRLSKFFTDPGKKRSFAESLYAVAQAMTPEGIDLAVRRLEEEARREEEESRTQAIQVLEMERQALIQKLEKLRTWTRADRRRRRR
jgi:hypothetical protein